MSFLASRWADICRSVPQMAQRKRLAPSPSETGQSESGMQRRTRRFNRDELERDLRRRQAETGSWFYSLSSASCERRIQPRRPRNNKSFWWRSGEEKHAGNHRERHGGEGNKHTHTHLRFTPRSLDRALPALIPHLELLRKTKLFRRASTPDASRDK